MLLYIYCHWYTWILYGIIFVVPGFFVTVNKTCQLNWSSSSFLNPARFGLGCNNYMTIGIFVPLLGAKLYPASSQRWHCYKLVCLPVGLLVVWNNIIHHVNGRSQNIIQYFLQKLVSFTNYFEIQFYHLYQACQLDMRSLDTDTQRWSNSACNWMITSMEERHNSIAVAKGLRLSCTNPSTYISTNIHLQC